MYRPIVNEHANTQKKFPMPAKSIVPTSSPWSWSIPIINNNFSEWIKELTPRTYQKKFAELNPITYKNHFQILVDGSKTNKKVASGIFILPLNTVMGEIMYDNVSITSAEIIATVMSLEHLVNNQPLITNLQNIIVILTLCQV